MPVTLRDLTVDAREPEVLARFWAALLDREVVADADGTLVPGTPDQIGLRFVVSPVPRTGRNRMHLHLTSTDAPDQQAVVERALALGATHLDVGQLPDEEHVVLADPEGNELCVIEPGNTFLAGCGFLGELNAVGSREVGLFWAQALGWALVWDHDGETAIQSSAGGTKLSWDGPPVPPRQGPDRQRLTLVVPPDEYDDEVRRLTALGATRLGPGAGDVLRLSDPDGNEFTVLRRR